MAQHNELGKLGEQIAARYLLTHGYTLLAHDWHFGHKDLDLVVQKDGVTVFVEVKTRSTGDFGSPEEAVDHQKIRNIISAAQSYVRRNNIIGPIRFDVIAVVGTQEPYTITHFTDAFNPHSQQWWR